MKYTAIILAFYFLALALLPCGDSSDCINEQNFSTTISSADAAHHDHHVENCSPFCICSCCGQFMYTPVSSHFELASHEYSPEVASIYRSGYFSIVHHDIWQPPKLS